MLRTAYSVLISGAGIAGPALAYWLSQTQTLAGFEVTVVERATSPREGGQAVDIRGAAREVVERMGLLPAIKAAGLDERGFAFVDERGKHQASMPVAFMGGEGIVAELEILRGDLSRILYEHTCADTEYRFDDSIHTLVQDDEGVQVTFVNRPPRRFDFVIGADGIFPACGGLHSVVISPRGLRRLADTARISHSRFALRREAGS